MAKRKSSKSKQADQPHRMRRWIAVVAALSCVLIAAGALAEWRQMRFMPMMNAAVEPAATPNSLAANNPVKEYIYAGGRLLATEEPAPPAVSPVYPTLGGQGDHQRVPFPWPQRSQR